MNDLPTIRHRISFDETTDETYFAPILVGVSGGSASGKTTLCNHISEALKGCVIFSLDNYYKVFISSRVFPIPAWLPTIISMILPPSTLT